MTAGVTSAADPVQIVVVPSDGTQVDVTLPPGVSTLTVSGTFQYGGEPGRQADAAYSWGDLGPCAEGAARGNQLTLLVGGRNPWIGQPCDPVTHTYTGEYAACDQSWGCHVLFHIVDTEYRDNHGSLVVRVVPLSLGSVEGTEKAQACTDTSVELLIRLPSAADPLDVCRTIYKEDFDQGDAGWTHGGYGDEWGRGRSHGGATFTSDLAWLSTVDGTYAAYTDSWLISPVISLGKGVSFTLSWRESNCMPFLDSETGLVRGVVEVQRAPAGPWKSLASTSVYCLQQPTQRSANITEFQDGPIRIRFHFTERAGFSGGYGWTIDDVAIRADTSQTEVEWRKNLILDWAQMMAGSRPEVQGRPDGSMIIYLDINGNHQPDPGERILVVPAPNAITVGVQGNEDGSTTVYRDPNGNGRADDGEELVVIPPPPLPALATETSDDGSLTLYDDRDRDGEVDPGEAILVVPAVGGTPSAPIKLEPRDDGSVVVYNDANGNDRADEGEVIATIAK